MNKIKNLKIIKSKKVYQKAYLNNEFNYFKINTMNEFTLFNKYNILNKELKKMLLESKEKKKKRLILKKKKKKLYKKIIKLKLKLKKKIKTISFLTKKLKKNKNLNKKKYILKNFKTFRYFLNDSRFIVRKVARYRIKKKSLIFLIKYRLLKIATKNINYIKIKLKVKNIFISFYRRAKGLFVKATCGLFGFVGAKKSTTFAYEHTALNIGRDYYKKNYVLLKYKNIRDKLSKKRRKRKACVVSYSKSPLFFNLQHIIFKRQIRSIIRGFKKAKLEITFLNYNPKSAHNGLWLRKKKRV